MGTSSFVTTLLSLFGLAASMILEQEKFPDVDVHQLELQRYNMANYFYGSPLNYSLEPASASQNMYFKSSNTLCSVPFKGTVALSFMLDPLTDDMPQVLLVLYTDFVLAMYQLNDSCVPSLQFTSLADKFEYDLISPISLFAYYQSDSVFYVIINTLATARIESEGKKDEPASYIVVVKWDASGPTMQGMAPAGELANATMLVYEDMLFAFHQCVDRKACKSQGHSAVYGYLLHEGRMVRDLDPYLIAKLDDEFFNQKGVMVRDMAVYNGSLLICDIGNNLIYQVRMSATDRLPSLRRHFAFLTRAENVAVSRWTNTFYVSARLSGRNNAEVLKVRDNNLADIYYDYSQTESELPRYKRAGSSYRIAKTCNTKHFHFSLIYNAANLTEQYIRALSFDNKYIDIVPVDNVVLLDCYLYQYDYILTVRKTGYHLVKYKFPELIINYTASVAPMSGPVVQIFNFQVRSPTEVRRYTRKLTLYPANSIAPSMKYPPDNVFPVFNYKGMTLSVDLSRTYGGLVSNLSVVSRHEVEHVVKVEAKWEQFAVMNMSDVISRYAKLVESAKQRSLLLSEQDERIYAFPFNEHIISGDESLEVFCFQVVQTGKTNRLTECANTFSPTVPIPPSPIVGPVVRVTEMYYASVRRDDFSGRCYLDLYQYDPGKKGTIVLRKIVTEAFSAQDEILSLIYNPTAKPKSIIVYGNRNNKGFLQIFGVQSEEGKFSLKSRSKHTTTHRILKGGFLPDCNVAIFLCNENDRRYLLIRPFVEVKMATDIIPIKENVADFLTYGNHIIAVTEERGVFQYTLDYPDLVFVRSVPLPENAFVVMRNGKAIVNIDTEMTGRRLFIYLLVAKKQQGRQYQIYVFDILDTTRNAPYLTIDVDPRLIRSSTAIYDLVTAKYAEHSLVLLVANEFVMPILFRDHMSLQFSNANAFLLTDERISVHPNSYPDLLLNFNLTEIDTPLVATQKARSDEIVALPGAITLDMDDYIKGYGVDYHVNDSSTCEAELVEDFCLLQEVTGAYNDVFYLILSNEKLFIYTGKGMIYSYEINYGGVGDIIPPPKGIYNLRRFIVPQSVKILYKTEFECYYGAVGYREMDGLVTLAIYNQSNTIYESQIDYGTGAMLLNGNRLGVFVYIHALRNSFYGKVLNVTNSVVATYDFNSFDLGCETGGGFDCTISKLYPLLYCINSHGEIYTVELGEERASLRTVTNLGKVFKRQFSLLRIEKEMEKVNLHSTYSSELYIFINMGVIRCQAHYEPFPVVSCTQSRGHSVLNIIPNYLNYNYEDVWASDGKVFAVLVGNQASPEQYAIRFINVQSPFDSTEVRDMSLSDGANVSSIAVNSTAFGNTGIVLIQYFGGTLRVLNFSMQRLVNVRTQGARCQLDLLSASVLRENNMNLTIRVETLVIRPLNIALVFGCVETMLGFAAIFFLTRSYFFRKRRPSEDAGGISVRHVHSADSGSEEDLAANGTMRRAASQEMGNRRAEDSMLEINAGESFVTVTEEKKS